MSFSFRAPQVNLYVRDVETSMEFYTRFFGFRESFRTPDSGPPDHVELKLGGFILGLASIQSAREAHGLDVGAGSPRGEICLWTDDVDPVYEHLIASGVPPITAPHTFLGRLRAAWVADPDDNPVEIVAEVKQK